MLRYKKFSIIFFSEEETKDQRTTVFFDAGLGFQ